MKIDKITLAIILEKVLEAAQRNNNCRIYIDKNDIKIYVIHTVLGTILIRENTSGYFFYEKEDEKKFINLLLYITDF